ncbi:MAG TPA: hypothetical protein PLU30_12945 [Verrucomicrobiae bacterium]|nr:hypothetical protein [Verrucomicrobiae bacterium]
MRNGFLKFAGIAVALGAATMCVRAQFSVSQYTNGVPQTTNGVTFVLVTQSGQAATRITNDTRWTANNVYVLDKLTFVEDGAKLTIEPGTIVRGEVATKSGTSVNDPADPGTLVICRGAKIIANGTYESPIVFTSIDDYNVPGGLATVPPVMNGSTFVRRGYGPLDMVGFTNYGDNGFTYDEQWGGVIVLGKTRISQNNITGVDTPLVSTNTKQSGVGTDYIEGFQTFTPEGIYGGTDDEDDSGVMRFLSIRYAGFVLSPNNEINGLSLGAVGRNTALEFVEIFNNKDDGIEWFGGTVNSKYMAVQYQGDDCFDMDEGYRGKGQFWFGIMDDTGEYNAGGVQDSSQASGRYSAGDEPGNQLMEMDGGENVTKSDTAEGAVSRPFSIPTEYNMTLIGRGVRSWGNPAERDNMVRFRANCGGHIRNTIVTDCATNIAGMLRIDGALSADVAGANTNFQTIDRYVYTRTLGDEWGFNPAIYSAPTQPDLTIKNVRFYNSATESTNQVIASANRATIAANLFSVSSSNSYAVAPLLNGIGRLSEGKLDPRLQAASLARTAPSASNDGFFNPVGFQGAFLDNNWLRGWSVMEALGVFTNAANLDDGPAVKIAFAGSDPTVSFPTVNGVVYTVDKSVDLKHYTPLAVVTGNGLTAVVTNIGAGISTQSFYRVIAH